MRSDSLGLFWRDEPKAARVKKEKVRPTPPEPVWLRPDYLPNLDIASRCMYDEYSDQELIAAAIAGEVLDYDIECYPNYFLIGFRSFKTKKYIIFDMVENYSQLNVSKLRWVMENFVICGFNSSSYDNTMALLAIAGNDCRTLKQASDLLIVGKMQGFIVLRQMGVSAKKMGFKFKGHIDLMPVAPRRASLKKYAARCGIEQMQDLPIDPNMELTWEHILIIRWYWGNDIESNYLLHERLIPQIELREKMGQQYGLDLLAKSDPQIAEAIFVKETKRLTGVQYVNKPNVDNYVGTTFKYQVPAFIRYSSPTMQAVLDIVRKAVFRIDFEGKVECEALKELKFHISDTPYTMGIGGLHSAEKKRYFRSVNGMLMKDHDVTSYYPNLILALGMYPEAIGRVFLEIYNNIKNERVHAKRTGDKVTNESLKIVINGSFGKFGDPFSYLYAPNLLIQTTLTGQLSLLMLIERMELSGIKVISANTDGIVTYCHESRDGLCDNIISQWQIETGLELEHVLYKGLFSRDVNNYFAIKEDNSVKGKGIFALSSIELDPKYEICSIAVMDYLSMGKPIEKTINECNDIKKFVMVKSVTKGAVKDGEFLGKVVRFYRSSTVEGQIVNAANGYKVPTSDNCRPAMRLPSSFPDDVDKDWYIQESYKLLAGVGYEL